MKAIQRYFGSQCSKRAIQCSQAETNSLHHSGLHSFLAPRTKAVTTVAIKKSHLNILTKYIYLENFRHT